MISRPQRRGFGILTLAAGVLLFVLEFGSYRQGGEVSWFWLIVGGLAVILGLFDIISKSKQDEP